MTAARGRGSLAAAARTPTGVTALAILGLLVALAIAGPAIWGDAAGRTDVANLFAPASGEHPLGTDQLGRDIFARVMVATRLSLLLAILAIGVGAGIGIPLGALPAVAGPRWGRVVNALIDFSVAFPALLLAIFTTIVIGVGSTAVVLAIGLAAAPSFARLTQTLAASVAGSDYVAAARIVGVGRARLIFRHILPNVAEPLLLNTTIAVGYALVAIAGLSFLGIGVQPPDYDWGQLLDAGLERIYVTPGAALGPAAAIVIAGLAFNGVGEMLAGAAGRRLGRSAPQGAGSRRAGSPAAAPGPDGAVLDVSGLTVRLPTANGEIVPVRELSLSLRPGEIVGIVGESGSGKTLTAQAIAQLLEPPAAVEAERLELGGRDPRSLPKAEARRLLGTSLAMVFQDPAASLNPALRVGRQLAEVAETHAGEQRREATRLAVERLRSLRISSPERRAAQYPHELSGGMRQRAMIAMGIMGQPGLIIADEPTSALDVTVQQQVLRLLREVPRDTGAAVLFISHDMAVVAELCERVVVMYAGRIVEELGVEALAHDAAHPYTRALVASVPDMETDRDRPLATIEGRPPEPHEVPDGCAFAPRCPFATARCRSERPVLSGHGSGRLLACWHPQADRARLVPSRVGSGG